MNPMKHPPLTSATAPGTHDTAPTRVALKPWGKGFVTRLQNLQTGGEFSGVYFERHEFKSTDECYRAARDNYLARCQSLGVGPTT